MTKEPLPELTIELTSETASKPRPASSWNLYDIDIRREVEISRLAEALADTRKIYKEALLAVEATRQRTQIIVSRSPEDDVTELRRALTGTATATAVVGVSDTQLHLRSISEDIATPEYLDKLGVILRQRYQDTAKSADDPLSGLK